MILNFYFTPSEILNKFLMLNKNGVYWYLVTICRRASSFSIVDDDAVRTRKLIRQYSVTCQTYPKRPFRPPKSNEVAVVSSISSVEIFHSILILQAGWCSGSTFTSHLGSLGSIHWNLRVFFWRLEISFIFQFPVRNPFF